MTPVYIKGATHKYAPPSDWSAAHKCEVLMVRVQEDNGLALHQSAWQPTPEELALLNAGGSVVLSVVGGQPPVGLHVEEQ